MRTLLAYMHARVGVEGNVLDRIALLEWVHRTYIPDGCWANFVHHAGRVLDPVTFALDVLDHDCRDLSPGEECYCAKWHRTADGELRVRGLSQR